jgi:hypothetical protein
LQRRNSDRPSIAPSVAFWTDQQTLSVPTIFGSFEELPCGRASTSRAVIPR